MVFCVSFSLFLDFLDSVKIFSAVFGIRDGTRQAKFIRENRPTRAYRIKGKLGEVTDNCFKTGKVVMKSTWRHVKQEHMDRFLSAMQASHQKKMFEMCGVDIQSQTAYELAIQGPIRPANSKIPIIYGIKCIEFQPPEFTVEIQCINEYEDYLTHIIHEIGQKLHSTAHCTGIQCIRHSRFTLEHALLMKHWTLTNLLKNMDVCSKILVESGENLPRKSSRLV
ncbi:hypothetical protein ABEB36_005571 [Hypothenemus hampei]|uniref:Pseudouridine synthase II N-terminal domain-containing protein n=1 Tax=Hypothenemus hampei TaxID=57062 RepID=A0ABD1EZ36_HYPHA